MCVGEFSIKKERYAQVPATGFCVLLSVHTMIGSSCDRNCHPAELEGNLTRSQVLSLPFSSRRSPIPCHPAASPRPQPSALCLLQPINFLSVHAFLTSWLLLMSNAGSFMPSLCKFSESLPATNWLSLHIFYI